MSITNFNFIPGSQYLFNRAYTLTIGAPGATTGLQYSTMTVPSSALRLKFDIDKNMIGASNMAKIELYNLAAQTRQAINKGYVLTLKAGYNNLVQTLFIGSVINTKSDRTGPDIITSLECGDGESAITNARLDKSYPAGVTLALILQDIGQAMAATTNSQPIGIAAGVAVGIPPLIFDHGFVAHGTCRETLDMLLKPQNLEWNVQNGNLNIIPLPNFNGQTAQIVSSQTGMIGVPSKNEFFVQFESLLNPKIIPSSIVQLISENTALNGFYKIRRSHFEGDTHDQKWQLTAEAIPITNPVQVLPIATGFNYSTAVT